MSTRPGKSPFVIWRLDGQNGTTRRCELRGTDLVLLDGDVVSRCERMSSADEVIACQVAWRVASRAEGWQEQPA